MEIGFNDNSFLSEHEKDIISQFTYECLVSLKLSRKIINALSIDYDVIFLDDNFDGRLGNVDCDDDRRYPKFFTIEILIDEENPKFLDDVLLVIAHESVHIQQFATNRLKYGKFANKMVFESIEYDRDALAYEDLPWEVEAFSKERLIYENALKQLKDRCTSLESA